MDKSTLNTYPRDQKMNNGDYRKVHSGPHWVSRKVPGESAFHFCYGLCCIVICRFDTARITLQGGTSTEKMCPAYWPMKNSLVHFLDCWSMEKGPAHYRQYHVWTGRPGCYKNSRFASNGPWARKQYSYMASASVSSSRFLSWLSLVMSCSLWGEINPFFLQLLFGTWSLSWYH